MDPNRRYPYKLTKKQLKKSYEIRLAAQFGDRKAKKKLADYNRQMKEMRKMVGDEKWEVVGRKFSRYQMMDYICSQISEGVSLPEVCRDHGMPSMRLVYSWFDNHPEFKKAYERAEEIRGHILGEKATEIGFTTDRENVAADKLKVEVLSKAAARANRRFQDKAVVENVDEFSMLSVEQLRDRVARMLQANPELAAAVSDHPTVPGTDLPSLSFETQDQNLVDIEPLERDAPGAIPMDLPEE